MAEVEHTQASKEFAVIQQNSHCGTEQWEKAETNSAAAKPVRRGQAALSRAGVSSTTRRVHLV